MAHVFDTDLTGRFDLPTRGHANAKSDSSASGDAFRLKLDRDSLTAGDENAEGAQEATAAEAWIVPSSALLAQLEAANANDETANSETEMAAGEATLPGSGLLAAADLAAAGLLQEAGPEDQQAGTTGGGNESAPDEEALLAAKAAGPDGEVALAAAETAKVRSAGDAASEALISAADKSAAAPGNSEALAGTVQAEDGTTPTKPVSTGTGAAAPELLHASAQLAGPPISAQASPARTCAAEGKAAIATPEILRSGPASLSLTIDKPAEAAAKAAEAQSVEAPASPETIRFANEDAPAPDARDRAAADRTSATQPPGPTAITAPAPVAGEAADAATTVKSGADPVTGLERIASPTPVSGPAPAPAAAPTQPSPQSLGAPPPGTITAAPQDVVDIISRNLAGDERPERITVQLDPPELGRISIDFKFDGQALQHVTITGQTPEAVRQLRLLHFDLVQSLEQQGLSGQDMTFQDQSARQDQPEAFTRQTAPESEGTEHAASLRPAPTPIKRPLTQITTAGLDVRF